MNWELFERRDVLEGSRGTFISVSPTLFRYNARFVREAGLTRRTRVSLRADSSRYRLGFEFHADAARRESFALVWRSGARHLNSSSGVSSAASGIVQRFDWVRRVAELPDPRRRRFTPRREGRLWVIDLCPAFERRAPRDGRAIPADALGIYRYVRAGTGEVVYIGRGHIRARLRGPERASWRFDGVEYSLVPDPEERKRWERYWIEAHRREHGRLPEYNKV